jgi:hypothetical protein
MIYADEMPSYGMIFLPSFIKTGTDVEGTLRFCVSNLKVCNVHITEGQGFCNAPLK